MRTTLYYFFFMLMMMGYQYSSAQQLVNVQVTMVPPVSPYLNQMLSSAGGRMMVQVTYNGQPGTSLNIKLAGKLERLSPSPLTIELNQSFLPAQPIILQAGVPLFLTNNLISQSFGNLNENNLVFSGTSPSALKEGITYKLPEGLYRLCVVAYSYGQGGQQLSAPNTGCATFTVCYKAAPPQLIQPVNSVVLSGTLPIVKPSSPFIFSWTAPVSTCGIATSMVEYDFEIRKILPGQTVTDAINNPYVFLKKALPSASFLLDTNLYKNILQHGQRYVVRVKANNKPGMPPIEFDNLGYSRVEAFQYGDAAATPAPTTPPGPVTEPVVSASTASCGLPLISNKTLVSETNLNNSDVMIGGFTLHIDNSIRKSDGSFSGDGYINWKPVAAMPSPLKLSVLFSNVKINTDKVVFEGTAVTTTQSSKPGWASLAGSKTVQDLLSKISPSIAKEISEYSGSINSISKLTGVTKVEMPLGWNTISGSKDITLSILQVAFNPQGSDMTLLHSFNLTEAGPDAWLSMAGTGFCIKPDGFNFSKGTLYLPADRSFTLGSGGEAMKFTLKGASKAPADVSGGTYLDFTGAGIEKITATAELSFPKSMLLKDEAGKPGTSDLTAAFKLEFLDWEDWMAQGTIPDFQIAGVNGWTFTTTSIFFDHSQKTNPSGLIFPDEYTGIKSAAFDGLYIPKLQVTLPTGFKTFSSDKRLSFSANHLLIDKTGITTHLKGTNIVSLSTGNLGGWSFSISEIVLLLVSNTFRNGSINGEFLLPVSSTALGYQASLLKVSTDIAYEFTVKPKENMNMDMLLASLQLHPSSVFQVKQDVAGIAVTANLNGSLGINTGGKGVIAALLPELKFNNLALANRNPATKKEEFYFNADTWSFSSPPKAVGGFPVRVNKIIPYIKPGGGTAFLAGLQFDLNIDIGFGDKTMISGTTTMDISGKVSAGLNAPPKAAFNELAVKKIKLEGDVGPVSIAGLLEFYKRDAVYGDGLKGKVSADFKIAKVDGTAQFGKTTTGDGYNYWFVDARASLPKPIPLVGPLGIAGFGGGAFYNMSFNNDVPKSSDLAASKVNLEDITPGKTASGLNFIPQKGKAGLKATIITALTEPKSFNGDVTLTAVIDMTKGSFSKFGLNGNAYFVTDYPTNKNPFVKAMVDASYDIPSTTFNLNATVDAKFASVTARVPIGVYADPSKWFVKVGDPFGERVSFTFLDMSSSVLTAKLNANAYLAAGNVLDGGLPPLPAEVSGMSGMPAGNPGMAQLISDINNNPGGGFALGAQVRGDFRASFLMLYAQAKAILGFDLMMKHFTNPIKCGGTTGGINNWYAIGQLYAYLKADVGVHVDVWFYEGDLSLCSVEAGAILDGGLPNPTWAAGRFAVNGSVLGGAVKVNTNFSFEMGDKCYPGPSDPLKDIKIITDYGPAKAGVFDEAYVVSNQPLGDEMKISIPPTAEKPSGEVRSYKFSIQSFTVSLNGTVLPDEGLQYSADRTVAMKKRRTILEPRKTYHVKVVCIAEQWYPELSRWDHPYNDETKKKEEHTEITSFTFETGDAPLTIPDNNIVLSYPLKGQRFVLKNEMGGSGKLQLNQWQPNILSADRQMKWEVLYVDLNKGDTIRSLFTPDRGSNALHFKLPVQLRNETRYRVVFWPKPQEAMGGITRKDLFSVQTKMSESTRTLGTDASYIVSRRTAEVTQKKPGDQAIYSFVFATSKFNSFSEKINALGDWKGKTASNKLTISNTSSILEPFDEAEVKGFTSPAGISYPSLLSAQLLWDGSKQNDAFANDKLYKSALVLAISGANINLGSSSVRKEIYKPVNTVDWSRMKFMPMIETSTSVIVNPNLASPAVSFSASAKTMGQVNTSIIQVNKGSSVVNTVSMGALTSVNAHQVIWNRESVMFQDYNLLKAFAQKILAFQKTYQQLEKTLSADALDDDGSPQLYTTNSTGGYAFVPLNKLGNLYNSPVNMNLLNMLASLPYQYFPKTGSRNMHFSYGLKGFPVSGVNKTFTY